MSAITVSNPATSASNHQASRQVAPQRKNAAQPFVASRKSIESTLVRFARHLHARRGLSEVTVHNYVSAIRRLEPVIGLKPTPKAIEEHIERMHKSGASYSHIVNTSIALEAYSAFVGRPIKLGRPKKPHHLVRGTLSEAEITLLIAAVRTLRDRAMLATLAYAGLRNRELCRLRIRDVDLAGQTLHVQATKTQKDRYTHIAAPCVSVLAEYMRERGGQVGDLLFVCLRSGKPYTQQNLRKTIRTAARRAGLKKRVYPHLLRHSLATNLLHRGAHLLAIKEQLGHAFVETTMIYVHSSPEHTRMQYRMYAPSYL
jgi:integrase/recombinase XerD